jgi:hypothetical protein
MYNFTNYDDLEERIINMLYTFFTAIMSFLYNLFKQTDTSKSTLLSSPPKSPNVLYIENEKQRFVTLFETTAEQSTISSNSVTRSNSNMDSVFYNLEEYNKIVANENSYLEKQWRSRILFENTPLGNIAMFYDVYKRGFTYIADTSFINSEMLNAVAMKYVRIYKCRDLFIDEYLSPECSPIIKLLEEEEKADNDKKLQKMKDNNIDVSKLKSASFAKLKKYDTSAAAKDKSGSSTSTSKSTAPAPSKKERILYKNKYIYGGKLRDYQFMQPLPKPKPPRVTFANSQFSSIFEQEHSLQSDIIERKKISYKDFRKNIASSSMEM